MNKEQEEKNHPLKEHKELSIMDQEEILKFYKSNIHHGLSSEEVHDRQQQLGLNEMTQEDKETIFEKLMEQFTDPMVILLLLAAIISFVISFLSSYSGNEEELPIWIEPMVIIMILIANGIIGVYQDYSADQSVELLKGMQSKYTEVLRDGVWKNIQTQYLTIGDIVQLQCGDVVPADMRILKINSFSLQINQSMLNGESIQREKVEEKQNELYAVYDQTNMIYAGTSILAGLCIGIVQKIGDDTQMGKIKQEIEEAKKSTEETLPPLKQQLNDFGTFLAKAIAVICLVIWVVQIPKCFDSFHNGFILGALYYFKQAVALGVAAIPEGLPAVITTCLALGTRRMIKKNALVRKLPAVETLGCTQVICSDKTGTLTQNEMTVTKFGIFNDKKELIFSKVTGKAYSNSQDIHLHQSLEQNSLVLNMLSKNGLYNSDSQIREETQRNVCIGLPTEGALMAFAESLKFQKLAQSVSLDKLFTLHFTSRRKMMSVLVRDEEKNENTILIKGAAEKIVDSSKFYLNSKGEKIELTEDLKKYLLNDIKNLASQGLRILGMSYKQGESLGVLNDLQEESHVSHPALQFLKDKKNVEKVESDGIFLGLICIKDPVKPNIRESILKARQAGITVFMITGDFEETALAISKEIDLVDHGVSLKDSQIVISGNDWEKVKPNLKNIIQKAIKNQQSLIFARTTPSHKRYIVDIVLQLNQIVAMTGDGVNDAPALKQASIGIAMGIHSTDVAKEASDLILLDDNFATIISAIEEGRSIYANMKAFIRYMISSNIGEVISIFISSLLGIPEAFNSIQLLWVNLVTDGLPATALSFNNPDPDTLKRKPRKTDEKLVDQWIITRYMIIGLYVGIATSFIFVYYYTNYSWSGNEHTLVSFAQLKNWTQCASWDSKFIGFENNPCEYFVSGKKKASTLSLTVLVMIEMWNALNAMSEDQSLFTIGLFDNLWLWGAIGISTLLHCLILYIPFLAKIFSTTSLNFNDWLLVLIFSLPVILIEEILKYYSRQKNEKEYGKRKRE